MSKTGDFYTRLLEERETESEFLARISSLIDAIATSNPELANRIRAEVSRIDASVERLFRIAWQEVESTSLADDSEILVVLARYVQFLLLRDCEKWMLGGRTSEKTDS